jgi:hypothetical protein
MCTDQSPGDLTPFLQPVSDSAPFEFVQAILTSWDPSTLENQVTFAGGQVESDLLVIGDPDSLTVNDAVMVLRSRTRYFILGPIATVPPGNAWVHEFNTANPTTNSTAYTALAGGDILGAAFVAPASGAVEITVQGWLSCFSATLGRRTFMSPQVREGSTVNAGTIVEAASDEFGAVSQNATTSAFDYKYVHYSRVVTGLTPGADYNVTVMHRVVTAGDNSAANDRALTIKPFG